MKGKAEVFDLLTMESRPYESRGENVFYSADTFKTRIIQLGPGQEMPACRMASHVVFVALEGEANIRVEDEDLALDEGKCLVTPPATISMRTAKGVRMLGIQIHRESTRLTTHVPQL